MLCIALLRYVHSVEKKMMLRFALGFSVVASVLSGCAPANTNNDASTGTNVELCSSMLQSTSTGCAAADVGLSTEICRCGSKYFWNGATCEGTAACRCTRNCDRLFTTMEACVQAYQMCASDGGARD